MIGGMSPEEFQNYLGLLSRLLRLRATERESIEEELRSHLEERLAALTAEGIEPARAISMALAEFGDAAALAAEFTAVSRYYKKRWIMRLTVGSIAASIVMAAVLVSYWPGGPARLTQNEAQAQQGEKVKETPALNPEKVDANAQTRAKLEKLVNSDFVDTPLSQVFDFYANKLDVQFLMDTRVLADAGITSDTSITKNLKNVPADMILRCIFRDLGEMTYYLDNGVIIVTTQDEANSRLETQVYRIDDLIYSPPMSKNKEATDFTFAKKPNKVNYDSLIELISGTILPQTWDVVGGPASICPYRGTLVISQTADGHQEIQKLLKDLRQSINPDIEDEARSVPTSFGAEIHQKIDKLFKDLRQSARIDNGDEPTSGAGSMGGTGGSMSGVESSNKEPEKKDAAQPSSEKEKKVPRDPRSGGVGGSGGGMF
jgi:hypothetical protein